MPIYLSSPVGGGSAYISWCHPPLKLEEEEAYDDDDDDEEEEDENENITLKRAHYQGRETDTNEKDTKRGIL